MADYRPLLARTVANLPSTSTVATRRAIYERAREAQLAQLGTLLPPLPDSDVAREKEALDRAIASVEAKFSVMDFGSTETPFLATIVNGATQHAGAPPGPANAARTEASIPSLSHLTKIFLPDAREDDRTSWPSFALAAILGAVLAISCAAIVMRPAPRYLASPAQEAQEESRARGDFDWSSGSEFSSPGERSSVGLAPDAPAGELLTSLRKPEPATQFPEAANPAVPETPRAAMVIASDNPQSPVVSLGSTVWSTIEVPGHPAQVAVKADATLPELKMHATMTLRRNADPTLPATHTIDLKFSFADGAPITGVKDVEPKMRNLDSTESESLRSAKVRLSDVYFLIALAGNNQDAERNLDLMQKRDWFDFALLLNDNRIAKLVFEKSATGEAILAKAFEAWK